MKVAFYFNDSGFSNLDLRNPNLGNNGVGGTQFCFLMVAYSLIRFTDISVTFYHYNDNILPNGIIKKKIKENYDILSSFDEDILVFKAEGCTNFEKNLVNTNIKSVAWAHNYLLSDELKLLSMSNNVKRVVFVGREQYDRYIDHPIIKKSKYIYNMFNSTNFKFREFPEAPAVTYTGSLVYSKGFHILAMVWKGILKKVPQAQLYVIGSGSLYNRNTTFGKYDIAEESYEKIFIPYLVDKNKRILPSVHFLGTIGIEKKNVYNKTVVGVMNPSGKTETFGLSAVEMEACGIPVITNKSNGLLDTSINKKTGYLIKNKRQLKKRIITLLQNKEKNIQFGNYAKKFVEKFEPEGIVLEWQKMFNSIMNNSSVEFVKPNANYCNNFKWLRIINMRIQKMGIRTIPIIDLECKSRKLIRRK